MNVVNHTPIRTDVDCYLSMRDLSAYSGLSVRTLRKALGDPVHPLPHYRPGGAKIVVKRSEFDVWMSKFRREGSDLDTLASEIVKEVVWG